MTTEFRIPDLGGATDVEVIEVSVAVGDSIEAEQTLLVLETDKASMEIPAEAPGIVAQLKVAVGDKVNEGDVFIVLEASASADSGSDTDATDMTETSMAESDATATASSDTQQAIPVPDLGGSEGVEVIEVAVSSGDQIDAEQTVLVLESDKATMEIPAGVAGTVVSVAVQVGDKVSQGDAMLSLLLSASSAEPATGSTSASSAPTPPTPTTPPTTPPPTTQAPTPTQAPPQPPIQVPVSPAADADSKPGSQVHAGPAVRKLARELGVDLTQVTPSGRKQRITKEDVQQFVKQRLSTPASAVGSGAGIPVVPAVDFSKFGPVRQEPLNNIKRATAKAMTTAWLNVPLVTQFDQADISGLERYRKSQNEAYQSQGLRFSIVPFVLKALAKVIREFPQFGASLSADGESLVFKDYVHIGVAVDTPKGLLVPVIRDVDRLSVTEITQQLNEKAQHARDGKLTLQDMQGGCFSLSSLGGIGGTAFTPIVNPPEVAILGLSKAQMQPVWDGETFVPKLMLPLSLSYDHRVIDGAEAARFSQRLVACLQDLRNVLM